MRVFFLAIVALVLLALGSLEVIASRMDLGATLSSGVGSSERASVQ